MDRSLNALFVMSEDNNVLVCELEYGMTEWSVSQASIADRAHVITASPLCPTTFIKNLRLLFY